MPSLLITPVQNVSSLQEIEVQPGKGWKSGKIALIEIEGMLINAKSGGFLQASENPLSIFAQHLEEVPLEIRPQATVEQRKKLGLKKAQLLLGLYDGLPLTRRSVEHSGVRPPVIYIFQGDIELASDSEGQLVEQVRKTVLHEIGHHFGMSERDLDELGYG